ncbi:unnamed protein product [Adineta ricciae]|uniref:Microsomal glutathione S-transferase 1 n=1 Tax=Adineta ricciae TaxID=249248 RepID=A0A814SB97_ADIRI|nr:unnamed protein product [Adineta ricciae]
MQYDQDRSRDKKFESSKFKTQESQKKFSRKHSSEHSKYRRLSSGKERKVSKPEFDDARLFCDHCNQYYDNICPYHKQTYIPDRKISKSSLTQLHYRSDLTCPDGIVIKASTISNAGKGVFTNTRLEKNTFFGPYIGLRHSNFKNAQESGYAWSIADKYGKMIYIIDGKDPNTSNWLRYINCPNTIEQQNLQPIQYDRNMFYKTTRTIRPGEELFVYYGDEYARFLGIEPFNADSMEKSILYNTKIHCVFSLRQILRFHQRILNESGGPTMSTLYYTLNNTVFTNFAFYSTASIVKLMSMAALTTMKRFSTDAFANPEDLKLARHQSAVVTLDDPDVERLRRNHLNDIENIVPFVLVGFFYVATNPHHDVAYWHFRIFLFSRLAHTVCYQMPLPQPGRFLACAVGYLTTLSMALQVLVSTVM